MRSSLCGNGNHGFCQGLTTDPRKEDGAFTECRCACHDASFEKKFAVFKEQLKAEKRNG